MTRFQESFVRALLIVGMAVTAAIGFLFYRSGWLPSIWIPISVIVLMSALALTLVVFNRQEAGAESWMQSRRGLLILAGVNATVATLWFIVGFRNHGFTWIFASMHLLIAFLNLNAAHNKKKPRQPANQ